MVRGQKLLGRCHGRCPLLNMPFNPTYSIYSQCGTLGGSALAARDLCGRLVRGDLAVESQYVVHLELSSARFRNSELRRHRKNPSDDTIFEMWDLWIAGGEDVSKSVRGGIVSICAVCGREVRTVPC